MLFSRSWKYFPEKGREGVPADLPTVQSVVLYRLSSPPPGVTFTHGSLFNPLDSFHLYLKSPSTTLPPLPRYSHLSPFSFVLLLRKTCTFFCLKLNPPPAPPPTHTALLVTSHRCFRAGLFCCAITALVTSISEGPLAVRNGAFIES